MGSTGKKRRKFTSDYRREAAHLVIDTGRTIKAVASELDIGEALLGRWVRQEREAMGPAGVVPLTDGERAELDRLRQEVVELRMDNEFLGKAAAFFAARPASRNGSR